MSSLNKAMIIGRLGKAPETKYTQGGDAVTNLSVATSERWTDKAGVKQEKTTWHRIVLFGRVAEIAGEYLDKGSLAYFEGRLQMREYEKDGQKHYVTEIVADRLQLLSNKSESGEQREPSSSTRRQAPDSGGGAKKNVDDFDSDIPFVFNDLYGTDERPKHQRRMAKYSR